MRWILLLLCFGMAQADEAAPASIAIELVDETGATLRSAAADEELPRDANVHFLVQAPEGSYLHLLQRNRHGLRSVHPSRGLVWVGREGVERVDPNAPHSPDEISPPGYNSEDDGPAEYLLVRSPVPRAEPADGWLANLEAFLIGLDGVNRHAGFALGGPTLGDPGSAYAAFDALRINLAAPSGFPNGRLVGDDVVDTALSVMAGTLCVGSEYEGVGIPDGVSSAGLGILTEFPFIGDPWHGQE